MYFCSVKEKQQPLINQTIITMDKFSLENANIGDVYTDGKGRLYKYIRKGLCAYVFHMIDAYGDKIGENVYLFDNDGHSQENTSDTNLCAFVSFKCPKHEPIWLAVDMDGAEMAFNFEPHREYYAFRGEQPHWACFQHENGMVLPKGSIEKLIGGKLTWEDGAVEYNS